MKALFLVVLAWLAALWRRVRFIGAKPAAIVTLRKGRLPSVTRLAPPPPAKPGLHTYSVTVKPSRTPGAATPAANSLEQQCDWLKRDLRAMARKRNDWVDESSWAFDVKEGPVTITASVRGIRESA